MVKLIDAFVGSGGQICIVMEYLPGTVVKDHSRQLIEGLREIHAADICHRDLAPTNIRLNEEGTVKYFDFGIGKLMS